MSVVPLRQHKIIFLNGPPHSGKDTVANYVTSRLPHVRHRKFSAPLKAAARAMFGVDDKLWQWLEGVGNNANKDVRHDQLLGKTWREVLIVLSEQHMKPIYGKEVFGELLLLRLKEQTIAPFTIISDSGFGYEAFPILRHYGFKNCAVWRLHRPQYTFDKDSRGYWGSADVLDHNQLMDERDIDNQHELDMFKAQINYHIKRFTGIDLKEV